VCTCNPGFEGDPFSGCNPIQGKMTSVYGLHDFGLCLRFTLFSAQNTLYLYLTHYLLALSDRNDQIIVTLHSLFYMHKKKKHQHFFSK
jgi:hypothetical protein